VEAAVTSPSGSGGAPTASLTTVKGSTLAFTGADIVELVALALVLLAVGLALRRAGRPRPA
jgi:hypothetical protein